MANTLSGNGPRRADAPNVVITLNAAAHYFAEMRCGFSQPGLNDSNWHPYGREWRLAFDALMRAAQAGEIEVSKEAESQLSYVSVIGAPKVPLKLVHCGRSKISAIDAAKVLNAQGWPIPDRLLSLIPTGLRKKFDAAAEVKEFSQRERQKVLRLAGLLVHAIAGSSRSFRKEGGDININAIADHLLKLVSDEGGRSIHGFSKRTVDAFVGEAFAAFAAAN